VDGAARDVPHAAAPVEDLAAIEVVEERVHREVAPQGVFMGLAEDVVAPDQDVVVGLGRVLLGHLGDRVATEGCDLDDLAAAEEHVGEAEAAPDDAAVAKQLPHVLRAGAGADVEVLGLAAEEDVAHAATDQVRLEARALQAAHHTGGVRVDRLLVEGDVVPDEARAGMPLEGGPVVGSPCVSLAVAFALAGGGLDGEGRKLGRRGKVVVGSAHGDGGGGRAYR
jgi:hypothetical protein